MTIIVVTLLVGEKIDIILAFFGGFACIPIAFTLPSLFHYRLCASSKKERIDDIISVIISVILMIFCSTLTFLDLFKTN